MHRRSRIALVAIALSLLSLVASPALAAAPPLQLDTGFGKQGLVTDSEAPPGFEVVKAMTVAPGRSIYVAAQHGQPGMTVIARYWRDGELERSFGTGGYLTLPGTAPVEALAADNSGRLLVLSQGTTINRIAGGKLDPSFGEGGSVSVAALGLEGFSLRSLASLPGGGVVAAGATPGTPTQKPQMVAVKLRPDGALDTSFNGTGFRVVRFGPGVFGGAYQVKVQGDGKLVLGGGFAKRGPALARLLPDGRLDPDFGRDGKALSPPRVRAHITALTVRRDGSILAGAVGATTTRSHTNNRALLLGYGPGGRLDRHFGSILAPESHSDFGVIPIAVMRAQGHIFLVSSHQGAAIRVFRLNGRPLNLGTVPGVPQNSSLFGGTAVAAPQDRKLVLAYTPRFSFPREVDLARFVVR
jgi:uncharacterized delta-60 repeat protein